MKSNKLGLLTTKIGSGITPRGGQSVYQNSGTHLIRSQNIYNHKFEKKWKNEFRKNNKKVLSLL